jgi:steroid delta-isomerase-like uncharacterized protein
MAIDMDIAGPLREAWSSRDAEAFAALFLPEGVRHEWALPGAVLTGRRAIAEHVAGYMHAVPDCSLEIRGARQGDGWAVLEWTFRGTHANDLPGLPASGEPVELPGVSVCDLRDGLLAEERVYWDAATLMAAAGVIG